MGYPMDAAVKRITPPAQCYQRRRPETTLWYRTVQSHFETWLALTDGPGDESILARIYETLPLVCPLWELALAQRHLAGNDPQWDSAAQSEPVFEFDQRVAW